MTGRSVFHRFRLSSLLGCALFAGAVSTSYAQTAAMRLIDANTGWLQVDNRLLWTTSAGMQWTEITPPAAGAQALRGVFFLDNTHGWLLRSAASGLELARTSDGGKTWLTSTFPLGSESAANFGSAAFDFLDSAHGWVMLRRVSSASFSLGALFATSDGGLTWKLLATPPLGDPVHFSTVQSGWLAGGPNGNQLYATADGGNTWQARQMARPVGVPAQSEVRYTLPVFENSSDGEMAVRYDRLGRSTAALYATHDGGASWQLRSSLPPSSNPHVVALADSRLLRISSNPRGVIGTEVDRRTIAATSDHALPAGSNVIMADFRSAGHGWILTSEGHCLGFKTACSQQQQLWATTDAGSSFQEITPAVLRDAAVLGSGQGFDLCSPTTSHLQTWYTNSPYRYFNVYIGGTNAACTQPGLSSSFVNTVIGQGWGLIPTWVGLQAPCSSCSGCSSFSSNTTTAASQGVSEAQSAANTMSSIGLAGTVIYYDLEQYNANSSCSAAASAFVNAWVQELHTLGYTAGVYGSPTNANSDWLNIANSPDAVWIALWNGVDGTSSLPPIPSSAWSNHQRLHQYNGGVNQTYGGVTMNVDQDALDGPISTTAQPSGFSVSAAPSSLSITQGSSGTSAISTSVFGGFSSAIALSASGLPAGATATFSPASIAAPGSGSSTLTIAVGSSAAVGSYSVTVTGTGAGVSETATIALTVNPSGGATELIVDGGFESATATGNSAPGWTATTNISGHSIIIYHLSYPHTGSNYAYEGAYNNDNDTLTQTVTIPAGTTTATLNFWANVVTAETTTTSALDVLNVEVHDTSGNLLGTVLTLSNLDSPSSSNTNGVYFQAPPSDLSAYAGKTIELVFHVTNNATNITTFRLDDISLLASSSGGNPNFTISAAPTAVTVKQGASGTSSITTGVSGGFNSAISLSASGLPTGTTASFSPASIAAPGSGSSTMTLNVGSSTATGTYSVTVTGTGGGITQTATVSLTVTSSGGNSTQLIVDGGFESATATGNSAPGWVATTNSSGHSIIIVGLSYPHTGSNYAYEGAVNSDNDHLKQTVTIPANATSAMLTFWVNVVTQETTTTVKRDFLHVEIHNSAGTLLATPLTLTNLDAPSDSNTNGVYFQPAAINLLPYAGQTIKVVFHSTTNATLPTTFRLDDVSLIAVTP